MQAPLSSGDDDDRLAACERALKVERAITAQQQNFLEIASHELRTPIAIIDSASQRAMSLITDGDFTGAMRKLIQARQGVARMLELVDRALVLAQVDAGAAVGISRGAIDVVSVLNAIARRHQMISPEFEIAATQTDEDLRVDGDPVLIDLIFTNLFSNAIKYSGASRRVLARASAAGTFVRVEIQDFGVGIPAAEMPKLFTRFFRASTAAGIRGTGIGLSLVRDLIDMHKGEIFVRSAIGIGTTFTVDLPVASPNTASAADEATGAPTQTLRSMA